MKLYRLADGTYVGTQAEAKASEQEWEIEEFPTDKPSLIERLNELLPRIPDTDNHQPVVSEDKCPRCRLTPKAAEKLALGMEIDAIGDRIMQLERWPLARLVDAVIDRLGELK